MVRHRVHCVLLLLCLASCTNPDDPSRTDSSAGEHFKVVADKGDLRSAVEMKTYLEDRFLDLVGGNPTPSSNPSDAKVPKIQPWTVRITRDAGRVGGLVKQNGERSILAMSPRSDPLPDDNGIDQRGQIYDRVFEFWFSAWLKAGKPVVP